MPVRPDSGGRTTATHRPLLGLLVVGCAIRFATLGQQSFWLDEAVTGRLMRLGFGSMLTAIPRSESTPPLYYILAWLWTRVFGVSEVGLRSLSALLGTATIPLVYAAGVRFRDRRTGLAAAALVTFAPLLTWYSQEARSYALLVALTAAGLWALAAALDARAGRRPLWAWAVISALALATHYFAVFVVAPEACWLIRERGRRALPASLLVACAGLALAPLAIHQRSNGSTGFIASTPFATRIAQALKQLPFGYDAPADTAIVVVGCLLAAVTIVLALRGGRRARLLELGGLGLAAVLLPAILAGLGYDYLITRNVIVAWTPAALAAGGVLATAGRSGAGVLIAACAIGLAVTIGIDLNVRYQRDDWRGVARAVPTRIATAVEVTPSSGRLALDYYLPGARPLGPGGARVAGVEVIALGARGVGAAVHAPALAVPLPTLAGFGRPVAAAHTTFTVVSYRATGAAVLVTPATLTALAPEPDGTVQLVSAGR